MLEQVVTRLRHGPREAVERLSVGGRRCLSKLWTPWCIPERPPPLQKGGEEERRRLPRPLLLRGLTPTQTPRQAAGNAAAHEKKSTARSRPPQGGSGLAGVEEAERQEQVPWRHKRVGAEAQRKAGRAKCGLQKEEFYSAFGMAAILDMAVPMPSWK